MSACVHCTDDFGDALRWVACHDRMFEISHGPAGPLAVATGSALFISVVVLDESHRHPLDSRPWLLALRVSPTDTLKISLPKRRRFAAQRSRQLLLHLETNLLGKRRLVASDADLCMAVRPSYRSALEL